MRALALAVLVSSSFAFAEGGVAALKSRVPELDANKRGRLATSLRPALESLGADALPELLEASQAPRDPAWADSAALAWQASLLEAMGTLADPRARAVFEKVLADTSSHFLVQRAAAEGLAKLGDSATLLPLIGSDAVVAGIGALRTVQVARALAAELATHPADARAKLIVRALSDVGNAWAWKTLKAREAEQATRHEAAAALVQAFVAYDGEVRQAASNALLVVDAAATPALIAQAKAGAKNVVELEALQARLTKNPLR